jgi:hypothetical protein
MATVYEEYEKKAKEKTGDKSLLEQAAEARTAKEGRREMFKEGGAELIEEAKKAPEDIMRATEAGVAKSLAAAPKTDIRALAGTASEQQREGAIEESKARQEAAAQMMDVAVAVEDAGTTPEDISAAKAVLTTGMNEIIAKHKGFWNDDEDAMYTEIMDMINDPTIPPELKLEFEKKADDIKSGERDV